MLDDGRSFGLDRPLLAVGCRPRRLPGAAISGRICEANRVSDIRLMLEVGVVGVEEGLDAVEVALSTGERLQADVAVVCIGVIPDTEWLADSGAPLLADGTIDCDEYLLVSGHAQIAAAGDAASWHSTRSGGHNHVEHWLTAVAQGAAASTCAGEVTGYLLVNAARMLGRYRRELVRKQPK